MQNYLESVWLYPSDSPELPATRADYFLTVHSLAQYIDRQ